MRHDFAHDFADFGAVTYLNCAFQGPMPLVAAAAAEEALELEKAPDQVSDEDFFAYPDAYRRAVAALVGVRPRDVAVTDSATHGLMLLVRGLDWRPGDEVVLPRGEFPANRFPWLSLERRGVAVREVPVGPGRAGLAGIEAAITPRTRVVAASWVSYSTGLRLAIDELGVLCRERGVLFAVDGTQGVGGLDLDLARTPCDLLACAGYKWLLGPYGLGFAWVEPELAERLEPGLVNWFAIEGARDFDRLGECELAFVPGAARFDVNEPAAFVHVAAGVASLRYLERVGVGTVERHVAALLRRLVAGLPRGFRDAAEAAGGRRSNILCLEGESPAATDRAAEALAAARVFVSRREGTIRLSPHLFNSADQVDRVLELLEHGAGSRPVAAGAGGAGGGQRLPLGERVPAGEARVPGRREHAGRSVILRPIDPERDAEPLWACSHGTPEREAIWTYMTDGPFADAGEMGRLLERRSRSRDPLFFTVVDRESSRALGGAAFQRIVPEHRVIEIAHLWLAPELQSTRANAETIQLLLTEAFDRLGYRRVEWKCDALNRRSRIAALRLGFRFEGVFRQHMVIKGRSRDTAWFALLDSDWRGVRRDLERWLRSGGRLSLTRLTRARRPRPGGGDG